MANCPICGRHLGTYTNDPILTNPTLSTVEYKGFTTLITTHITELQTERHQQEIDNGVIPLTVFSPINDTGLFQNIKQYITELRNSTEKILVATGMTLAEFLSTDEDGNPMTAKNDWSDPNLEEDKYQCKAIHIEDLRHYIQYVQMERFNISDIGNIILTSPDYGYFYGDIGSKPITYYLRPWLATLTNGTYIDSYSAFLEPVQDPGTGMWYFPGGSQPLTATRSMTSTATISELTGDKYLTAVSNGIGYVLIKQWYPAPNGWYPTGIYGWNGDIYSKTPALSMIFSGIFTNKRPIITENKIFTYDLDCIGSKSTSTIQHCPYGGSGYITQYVEKIPQTIVSIILSDKQIGESGIENTKTLTNTYSDIQSPGISGTFTIDVWNLWVKDNPTYKYVKNMIITLFIDEIYSAAGSIYGSLPLIGSNTTGSLTLNKWDNIGLINI